MKKKEEKKLILEKFRISKLEKMNYIKGGSGYDITETDVLDPPPPPEK